MTQLGAWANAKRAIPRSGYLDIDFYGTALPLHKLHLTFPRVAMSRRRLCETSSSAPDITYKQRIKKTTPLVADSSARLYTSAKSNKT